MGKLHSLRRAIERDPKDFLEMYRPSAWRHRGKWVASEGLVGKRSFHKFIVHVLEGMGYKVGRK